MSRRSGSAERVVLPCPKEPKRMAVLPGARVHVGRAVHGEHAVLDGAADAALDCLDLAAVAGASDNDLLALHIEDDSRGLHAIAVTRAHVGGRREHHNVGATKYLKLVSRGAHEHLGDEQRLVGALAHHHDLAGILAVGAREAAHHKQVAALRHVTRHVLANALIGFLVDGLIGGTIPVDVRIGFAGVNDVAVLGRATGEGTRGNREGTSGGEIGLVVRDRMLDELGRAPVNMHAIDVTVDARFQQYGFDHICHLSLLDGIAYALPCASPLRP